MAFTDGLHRWPSQDPFANGLHQWPSPMAFTDGLHRWPSQDPFADGIHKKKKMSKGSRKKHYQNPE
jgi:hypothetical protein